MRTTQATPATSMTFPRAATVRVSALATAFLTGTAAISLLVAPAAGAAALQGTVASGTQQSVSTTWGHDDRRDNHSWNKWSKPSTTPTTSNETKTVAWLMPKSTRAEVSWPQELVGTVPACGTGWYQVDVYRYGTDEEKKFVDAFMADGKLAGPEEDGKVYLSHQFVQPVNDAATCTPTTPTVPVTPPVVTPPVVTPPVVTPPVEVPTAEVPVVTPPVVTPPVVTPPVVTPPAVKPPVVTAPVVTPPVEVPAAEVPAAEVPVAPVVTTPAPTTKAPVSGVGGTFGAAAPKPTVVPSASGAATAPKPVAVATEKNTLAVTGAKVGLLSALAAVLVAAGVVAFRISRRTQATK